MKNEKKKKERNQHEGRREKIQKAFFDIIALLS